MTDVQAPQSEAEVLNPTLPIVKVNGVDVTLKRPSLRDTLDLLDDLMTTLGGDVDLENTDQSKLAQIMFKNMKSMFRVPSRFSLQEVCVRTFG